MRRRERPLNVIRSNFFGQPLPSSNTKSQLARSSTPTKPGVNCFRKQECRENFFPKGDYYRQELIRFCQSFEWSQPQGNIRSSQGSWIITLLFSSKLELKPSRELVGELVAGFWSLTKTALRSAGFQRDREEGAYLRCPEYQLVSVSPRTAFSFRNKSPWVDLGGTS